MDNLSCKPQMGNKETELLQTRLANADSTDAPRIHISLSPGEPELAIELCCATKINIDFTLESPGPITLFVFDQILRRIHSYSDINGQFDFVNAENGSLYVPSMVDVCSINHPKLYEVSYANSHNFLTLHTGVPYRLQIPLHLDPRHERTPMKTGEPYQMKLKPDSSSQHLWWAKGRKWQVLRWSIWPFGSPHNIMDFVCSHKGRENLAPVQFSCDNNLLVRVDAPSKALLEEFIRDEEDSWRRYKQIRPDAIWPAGAGIEAFYTGRQVSS